MSRFRQTMRSTLENGGSRIRLCVEKMHISRIDLFTT